MNETAFVVPAYNAGSLLTIVTGELSAALEANGLDREGRVFVVDDGSTDGSLERLPSWVVLITHPKNIGKGRALRSGMRAARSRGFQSVVTLDADAQHPGEEAVRLAKMTRGAEALVVGVRDLAAAGAPRPNQLSNRFSNAVLSLFAGTRLLDTQCGLRRYPIDATLALGCLEDGYAYEADVLLRAARAALPIVHEPILVRYPQGAERVSHFDAVRDPARIVRAVVATALGLEANSEGVSSEDTPFG